MQVFWTVKTAPGWAWNWKTQNKPKYHIPIKFGHPALGLHDVQSCNERIVVAPVWNIHVYIWYLCSKYAVHYRKCLIVILQELNIKPAYALLSFFDMRKFHFTFQKERKAALFYMPTKPKNSVKIKINISTQHKVTRCVFKRFFTKCFDPNIIDQAAETQILAANFLFLTSDCWWTNSVYQVQSDWRRSFEWLRIYDSFLFSVSW